MQKKETQTRKFANQKICECHEDTAIRLHPERYKAEGGTIPHFSNSQTVNPKNKNAFKQYPIVSFFFISPLCFMNIVVAATTRARTGARAAPCVPGLSVLFVFLVHKQVTVRPAAPLSYDHTTVKAPHPIRTAKLSTVGPDQYFGRGLQGNLGCCMA